MKPINLVISGWGPYKDREEIDFEELSKRGIFLIAGQTGAGKTTIFDAITYALYGDLSGNLRQKATVRSDFADAQTQTFVEFAMEHGGHLFRIRRNPEYQRPRKKKGGKDSFVTEKENAVLYFEDGSVLEGNREVNEKIRELLRLDIRQFRQISMIAQGEFAQLLHAGGDEKMKIFREIFGTSVYDLFLKKLKERAAASEKLAIEYLHRMEENVRQFSAEDERLTELTQSQPYPYREIAALLCRMEQEAEMETTKIAAFRAECEEKIGKMSALLAIAEKTNERFEQLDRQKRQRQTLLEKQHGMTEQEQACQRALAAAKVQEIWNQKEQAQKDLLRLEEQQDKNRAELKMLEARQKVFRTAAEKEEELEKLCELQETARQAEKTVLDAVKKQEILDKELKRKQKNYLEAENKTTACQQVYESLQKAQQYSMIGLVASMVHEGEPCPVCGSLEHPRIAQPQDGPDEKQLKQALAHLETARKDQMKCHGEAKAALELFEKQKAETEMISREAEQVKITMLAAEKELADVQPLFGSWPKLAEFRQMMRKFHETEAAIREKNKNDQQIRENISLIKERCEAFERQKKKRMDQLGFLAEEEWKAALMDEAMLNRKQAELTKYKEDVRVLQEVIRHLEEELEGKQLTDTTAIKEILDGLQDRNRELQKQFQKQQNLQENAGHTARLLNENLKRSGEAQAVYGVVKDLENMASGNNSRRLVFEQYVLASYFDDILHAANLRLKNMSGGRYELFRAERVSDGRKKDSLEIEVMDYYTGKRRSVRTLSGGETFKASLSLALGLSDAVCAASGGVKADTLFIDEGFGALDAQSLDQACSTLMSLAGENRLIGIISHVGELKERIPSQILVEKETAGSRIRVRHC